MKRKIIISLCLVVSVLIHAQDFVRKENVNLKCGLFGHASWYDFNGDGYLDIFITGIDYDSGEDFTHAMIYLNNKDNTFSESNIHNIPRVIDADASWGDYDNNGTPDLILSGGASNNGISTLITKIYKNINGNQLIEINNDMPGLFYSCVEWVDIDNDGLLDIYYQGINSASEFDLGIEKNMGSDVFKAVECNIRKINGTSGNNSENSAKWADFDNDGLKDVIIAMSTRDTFKLEFYKNMGNFIFKQIDIGLPRLNYVQIAVGDINQDGLMDFIFTGSTQDFLGSPDMSGKIYIYLNNGNMTFTKSTIDNLGVFINSLDLADFDNDGYPDILDYGVGDNLGNIRLFRNNRDNTFSITSQSFIHAYWGEALFGDTDNDNDLDLLISGEMIINPTYYTYTDVTYLYENKSVNKNSSPEAPDSISVFAVNNDLMIKWNEGKDDSTLSASLSYNLSMGTSQNYNSLISSCSYNGKPRIPGMGNMNLSKSFYFPDFPEGNFNARVQSVDNSRNVSPFSDTLSFCFKKTTRFWKDTLNMYLPDNGGVYLGIPGKYRSYLWNTGSTNYHIYINKDGLYNVNLTHLDGCISSETVYVKFYGPNTSLNNILPDDFKTNNDLKIYPVPLDDIITIEFNQEPNEPINISISDINGKQIFTDQIDIYVTKKAFSLPYLQSGIYFLTLSNESDTIHKTIKLVKK